MIIVARCNAKAERARDFACLGLDLAAASRAELGCIPYDLHEDLVDPARFTFIELFGGPGSDRRSEREPAFPGVRGGGPARGRPARDRPVPEDRLRRRREGGIRLIFLTRRQWRQVNPGSDRLEPVLAAPARGAGPGLGQVLEGRAGRGGALLVSTVWLVDVAAGLALVRIHGSSNMHPRGARRPGASPAAPVSVDLRFEPSDCPGAVDDAEAGTARYSRQSGSTAEASRRIRRNGRVQRPMPPCDSPWFMPPNRPWF